MTNISRLLVGATAALAAAIAVSGAAIANPKATKDKAGEAKPAAAAADTKAAKPAEQQSAAAQGPKVNREQFGEWELECFEEKINGLKCQIVQKLVSTEAKQLVLVVSVAYAPDSQNHLLQVALPLNFMLKPGVEIAIGDSKTVVPVDRCSAQGCFIEGIAHTELIDAMSKSEKGDVKFLASADKRLVVPFSLSGFSRAYEKMKRLNSQT